MTFGKTFVFHACRSIVLNGHCVKLKTIKKEKKIFSAMHVYKHALGHL